MGWQAGAVPTTAAPPKTPGGPGGSDPELTEPEPSTGHRIALVLGATFAVATFGVWIYALFFYDPGLMIDELKDQRFPKAAEEICHQARVKIEALPTASETKDHVERADVVDEANAALRQMTTELAAIVPTDGDAKEQRVNSGVAQWVDDWNTFIGDREDYATALREDPMTRFTESLKSNRQISRAIDAFAQVNRMDSCAVPGDVG